MALDVVPSPQSIDTVCASPTVGSVKLPVTVTVPSSSMLVLLRLKAVIVGAELFTVTVVAETCTPPSSSVNVIVTFFTPGVA